MALWDIAHAHIGVDSAVSRLRPIPHTRLLLILSLILVSCGRAPDHDLIIRGGTIYDGSGGAPYVADIAVDGDRIARIGDLTGLLAARTLDAHGQAVAPGFINMLSWATESLIEDGRALSDIKQGVTLEVMGEGNSMGPLSDRMKADMIARQGDITYDIPWTTLGEYLEFLTAMGVSVNVASFLGASTPRVYVMGRARREPTPDELTAMQVIVDQAMREGAMGVASALIYAPGFYAKTDELIALVGTAQSHGGSYISHIRSEGARFVEAVDELIHIARETGADAEIYHLKAAGQPNWPKLDTVFDRIEAARKEGLTIRTNMYTYTAGATGLDAAMPPWVQEGGYDAWVARLKDPDIRARVIEDMRSSTDAWENLMQAAGSPERVILQGFNNPDLKPLTGKTLGAVAAMRGTSIEDTAIDLVIEDGSRVSTIYFIMEEGNIRRKIAKPYMTFGSDSGAPAPEGVFLKSSAHPRAYGNFARLLGKYVREEKVISLAEAIKRLTSQPAANLKIPDRGWLRPGYKADLVIFDPNTIADTATFANPHQLAVGVRDVFVNGVQVLAGGDHTGAMPGQVVRGPGWTGHRHTSSMEP